MLYKPTYKKSAFRVKKPIRSFRDLEVYQRACEYATEVMTKIISLLGEGNTLIKDKLSEWCLRIPELIASAHSHGALRQERNSKFLTSPWKDVIK